MKNQATPVAAVPEFDKSRNVFGGFNAWAQALPFINFVMFFLGWFTVPVEVLFRRNFGDRWLTVINFYVGLLVLGIFNMIQILASTSNSAPYYQHDPAATNAVPSLWESLMNKSVLLFLWAYLLIASYHFFRIWWRNRTYTALHSFDDGTSRFEPVAVYLMQIINIMTVPIIKLYMLLLPPQERRRSIEIPPLVNDVTAFTNTIFELLILLLLAFVFPGTTRIWLLISAIALAIYASWKETARLNKLLDFRDSVIEAEAMITHRKLPQPASMEDFIIQQAAVTIKNNPDMTPQVTQRYPDLMSIIEEMNEEENDTVDKLY